MQSGCSNIVVVCSGPTSAQPHVCLPEQKCSPTCRQGRLCLPGPALVTPAPAHPKGGMRQGRERQLLTASALPQTGATGGPGRRICPTPACFQAAKTQTHVLWEFSCTQNQLASHRFSPQSLSFPLKCPIWSVTARREHFKFKLVN